MTELDAQSIIGAKLTGFHIAATRLVHLRFTQYQSERVLSKPELISAQVWLVRPKRIVFNLTKRDPLLMKVTFENSPNGVVSAWSFGDEEMLSVECKSISHIFLPVVTD